MKTALNLDVQKALSAIKGKPVRHVFLVACGGSLSVMMPGKYFLDRHSTALTSDVYNADEFVSRDPRKLDRDAIVILCSQTGTTKETTRAARHAKSKGATTIGMTLDATSPLGQAVDFVVGYQASYTTGVAIDAADSNYGVLYMLLVGLLKISDSIDLVSPLLSSLSHFQAAIDSAHVKYAKKFAEYAPRLATKQAVYTLTSGPVFGAAYSYSTCVLMEMQRYNSRPIHANEFFHGPFELVDKDASFIVLLGNDETRGLTERARDFLLRFGSKGNVLVLDSAELSLDGIDERFRGYFVPLIFFDTLWKFAYLLADKRGIQMLDGRRYMKKISDY